MISVERQPFQEANLAVDRYRLLNIKFPPFEAFDQKTLPYLEEEKVVFRHALCLERTWSANFWQESIDKLTEQERKDFQVIIIPPRGAKKGNNDFTQKLKGTLNQFPFPHSIATLERISYEEIEYGKTIKNMSNPNNVYIVGSPVSLDELTDIIDTALAYKNQGIKQITLIAPFIRDEREDKNVGRSSEYPQGKYNGRLIKIETIMAILSPFINRIITFEPHSGATQSFAAIHNMPLAPLSLQNELIAPFLEEIKTNRENWVVIRPDEGRNLVATRLEKQFDLPGIHLKKIRDSKTLLSSLADEENQPTALLNKNTLLYDDEGGTLGTIKNIVLQKLIPEKVASINICLAHARLQNNWRQNLDEIIHACQEANIKIKIVFSNTRRPLGNLKQSINTYPEIISVVGIEETVVSVIEACVNGINFWNDNQWSSRILQPIKNYDE